MARSAVQGSLFEEDYLRRSLPASVVSNPDVALTELVANAWDAGARAVDLAIPERHGEEIRIEDDGFGMTEREFRDRWMKLGYNRVSHQGQFADGPDGGGARRRAFGRNGIGRHAMLCFANQYTVETRSGGTLTAFQVSTAQGAEPFTCELLRKERSQSSGTTLRAMVRQNLPNADRIRRVISARFVQDPQFVVRVNGLALPLAAHDGLVDRTIVHVGGARLEVFVVDSAQTARTSQPHGIAFWVGGRLVGEPSWSLGSQLVVDGRTVVAKRYTVVVKSEDLFDEVLPDWSGFRSSLLMEGVRSELARHLTEVLRRFSAGRVQETTESVLRDHERELTALRPMARLEVVEFVSEMAVAQPTLAPESFSGAVKALIHLENSRSGQALLQKLSTLPDSDVEGLNRLLETWSVRDALTVLDEIDRRVAVIEALQRFSGDAKVDELHTLHPLVTQARWVFGAEFDSPLYASNVSIRRAVEKVFNERKSSDAFINYRNRPDLLALDNGTLSTVAADGLDQQTGIARLQRVLLIELKKGGFTITRKEVQQAVGYVEDLLGCGLLDGAPFINAFVVGERLSPGIQSTHVIGRPELAQIEVCTFGQLVRTAGLRLFRLREELAARYEKIEGPEILKRAMEQASLPLDAPRPKSA